MDDYSNDRESHSPTPGVSASVAIQPVETGGSLFSASFLSLAEDGALLGKIEKVRVLRNDRREGKKVPFLGHF